MNLINGKHIAQKVLEQIKQEVETLPSSPKLAIIQVGQDSSSDLYVSKKLQDAEYVGIGTEHIHLDNSTFTEIENIIKELNTRDDINGFFIQLPFPVDGEIYKLFNQISLLKDVDGLNGTNLGKIWQGRLDALYPATVLGVIECIRYVAEHTQIPLEEYLKSKKILVINHSVIVGKPLAGYLVNQNATVTIAHKFTQDLKETAFNSDIIISATGKKGLISSDMIKDGTVLIDVGISKTENGIFGDMEFETFQDRDVWLTPVPDGVGPLTRVMLLSNTLKAYKLQHT